MKSIFLMAAAILIFGTSAPAQTSGGTGGNGRALPVIANPGLDESDGTAKMSPQDVALIQPWLQNTKVALEDLIEKSKSTPIAALGQTLSDGINQILASSGGKRPDLLVRYLLNRATLMVKDVESNSVEPSRSAVEKISILLRTVKLAARYAESDTDLLDGKISDPPFADFGSETSAIFMDINENTLQPRAQVAIGFKVLGWLAWDFYRDSQKTQYADEIWEIYNFQKKWDGQNISDNDLFAVMGQIRDIYGRVVDMLGSSPLNIQRIKGIGAVAIGVGHTCVAVQGNAYCWGSNEFGQLGNGSFSYSNTPTQVVGLSQIIALAAGEMHTCAIVKNGDVYCWGYNIIGAGYSNTQYARWPAPQRVDGITGATMIAAGKSHTCALSGETLYCWGQSFFFQAGIDPTQKLAMNQDSANPRPMKLQHVIGFSVSNNHSCALLQKSKNQTEVDCWGALNGMRAGTTKIADLTDVKVLSSLGDHTCGVRATGDIACWGDDFEKTFEIMALAGLHNVASQEPNCTFVNGAKFCWGVGARPIPNEVVKMSQVTELAIGVGNVKQVTLGYDRSCAVVSSAYNERLFCWTDANNDPQEISGLAAVCKNPQNFPMAQADPLTQKEDDQWATSDGVALDRLDFNATKLMAQRDIEPDEVFPSVGNTACAWKGPSLKAGKTMNLNYNIQYNPYVSHSFVGTKEGTLFCNIGQDGEDQQKFIGDFRKGTGNAMVIIAKTRDQTFQDSFGVKAAGKRLLQGFVPFPIGGH